MQKYWRLITIVFYFRWLAQLVSSSFDQDKADQLTIHEKTYNSMTSVGKLAKIVAVFGDILACWAIDGRSAVRFEVEQ